MLHNDYLGTSHKKRSYSISLSVQGLLLQDLDIAIIKSTTSQFHVVPKEKHVQSKPYPPYSFLCCGLLAAGHKDVHGIRNGPKRESRARAELVNAIHVVRSRQDVVHVKTELLKRLRKASDWLVSTAGSPYLIFDELTRALQLPLICWLPCVSSLHCFLSCKRFTIALQTALKTLMVIHRLMRESNDHWLLEVILLLMPVVVYVYASSSDGFRLAIHCGSAFCSNAS